MREETKTFGVAIPPPGFSVSEWSGAGASLALDIAVSFLWFFDVCGRAALCFQLSKVPTLRSSAPADDRPGAACGQIRHATTPANSTARTATASQNFGLARQPFPGSTVSA